MEENGIRRGGGVTSAFPELIEPPPGGSIQLSKIPPTLVFLNPIQKLQVLHLCARALLLARGAHAQQVISKVLPFHQYRTAGPYAGQLRVVQMHF